MRRSNRLRSLTACSFQDRRHADGRDAKLMERLRKLNVRAPIKGHALSARHRSRIR